MTREDLDTLRRVQAVLAQALADLEHLEDRAAGRCVDELGRPMGALEAPSQDREDLEALLEHGRAHLTGHGEPPPPPTLDDLFPNQTKLVAEWPDGSRVTFGPFADDRNARNLRPLAKRYLDPQAAAEAVWSVEPFCPGEKLDVGAAALIALQG